MSRLVAISEKLVASRKELWWSMMRVFNKFQYNYTRALAEPNKCYSKNVPSKLDS